MLMKWEDLMPGDVIRVSEEIKERFPTYWYSSWWYNVNLVVVKIDILITYLYIHINYNGRTETFFLDQNGQYQHIDFFEIVELVED